MTKSFVVLALLLLLPALAIIRLRPSTGWWLLALVPVVASFLAFLAYRTDKRRAQIGAWRMSEFSLHCLEMAGGWPGAFLAQRAFRHKRSKTSYQLKFWLIVALHQLVAMDALLAWRFAKQAIRSLATQ
jgi:uncharacterized membrane protein YsdA (DUF1294 family)